MKITTKQINIKNHSTSLSIKILIFFSMIQSKQLIVICGLYVDIRKWERKWSHVEISNIVLPQELSLWILCFFKENTTNNNKLISWRKFKKIICSCSLKERINCTLIEISFVKKKYNTHSWRISETKLNIQQLFDVELNFKILENIVIFFSDATQMQIN